MAEIKITKKAPIWPWILLGLIILGAIVYFYMNSDRVNIEEDGPHIGQDEQMENGTGESGNESLTYFERVC